MNKNLGIIAAASLAVTMGAANVSAAPFVVVDYAQQGATNDAGVNFAQGYGAVLPFGASGGSPAPAPVVDNSDQTYQSPFNSNALTATQGYWTAGSPGVAGSPVYLNFLGSAETAFNILWGSIDTYNTITFYSGTDGTGGSQSFTGTDIINELNLTFSTNFQPVNADGNYEVVALVAFSGLRPFQSIGFTTTSAAYEFALVPIPPAALLFGTALAGVGFMSRRKKAQAAA